MKKCSAFAWEEKVRTTLLHAKIQAKKIKGAKVDKDIISKRQEEA